MNDSPPNNPLVRTVGPYSDTHLLSSTPGLFAITSGSIPNMMLEMRERVGGPGILRKGERKAGRMYKTSTNRYATKTETEALLTVFDLMDNDYARRMANMIFRGVLNHVIARAVMLSESMLDLIISISSNSGMFQV